MTTPFEPASPPQEIIPLCVPSIRGNAWDYVKKCLDTNWVSSVGPFVDDFEKRVAEYSGADFAVATVNGTSALHVALLVAGVEPGDEVLVSTLTFIASANAVRYAGAIPVFIDAEPVYWQMDPQRVRDFVEKKCELRQNQLFNKETGRRVRAIVPVHVLGHPVDIQAIQEIARQNNLIMIADAAEALGARYRGQAIGQFGDISCFSFNGNKIITTGGGGMLVTNDPAFAARARYLTTQAKDDPLEYIHNEMGFNYRLTNLQAALGCSQMEELSSYVEIKRGIAALYRDAFADVDGIRPMIEAPWAFSTFWLFTILVDPDRFGMNSRQLLRELSKRGIQSRPLWQPMHRSPSFAYLSPANCPVADHLYAHALSLPSSVDLGAGQHRVIEALRDLSRRNTVIAR